MQSLKRGILISVEGIDGSGKSTLSAMLTEQLRSKQFPVVLTKEPGGTALGIHLRSLLQKPEMHISSLAEYFLFAADRAQHFQEVIIPMLSEKKIIISDRLTDSSIVYQGYGRGLDRTMIETVNQWATQQIKPDLTLYIVLPAHIAYQRLHSRNKPLTSFEQQGEAFIDRLIQGFEEVLNNKPQVIRLDGTKTAEEISQQAFNAILSRLPIT